MTRGGKREGAGGRPKWNKGKTKTIRVPVVLVDRILDVARLLDSDVSFEDSGYSKVLNLSGVSLRKVDGNLCVFLKDLIKSGYQIKPHILAQRATEDINEIIF